MSICNLIKYVDNYSDISGSLWQLKRDEIPDGNVDLTVDNNGIFNFQSFKYKAALLEKAENVGNNTNSSIKSTKIVAPLNHRNILERNSLETA